MLGFHRHNQPVILTGSLDESSKPREFKSALVMGLVKLLVVIPLLLLVASYVYAPMSFNVRQGKLTYLMVGVRHGGGQVVFSLGPFGSVKFHTHKTPVNLNLDLEFNKTVLDSQTSVNPKEIINRGAKVFYADAWPKFKLFALAKLCWLFCFGALVGFIVSNGGRRRLKRALWFSLGGGIVTLVLVLGFAGYTYLTLNQQREMSYTGLSKDLPNWVSAFEQDGRGYQVPPGSYSIFSRGNVVEQHQATLLHQTTVNSTNRVRILAGGDFHSNVNVGLTVFNGILHDVWAPFDAVLLAGDLTQWGSGLEAGAFAGKLKAGKVPVRIVGGNHEDAGAMQEFQRIGFPSLNKQVLDIDGIKVLGMDDPLAQTFAMNSNETLLKQNSQQLADLWQSQGPNKPQVILVHDVEQANGVVKLAEKEKLPLTVIFGHDHKTSVERKGMITYVGCGTGGASGAEGLGDNPGTLYSYQILDFSTDPGHKLMSVVTLTYNGETGETTRTPHFFLN